MEITKYILGDFWRFIGFITILGMLIKGLVALVAVILNRNVDLS
jgi:hypothetical protein